MPSTLQERLAESLGRLRNPRTGADLFSTQQVRDIATTTSGRVRLTLLLAEGDDPALAKQVREAVGRVEGVTDVELDRTAQLFLRDAARRTIRLVANEPNARDMREYVEKRRESIRDYGLDESDDIIAYLPIAWVGDHIFSYAQAILVGLCVNCPESPDTVVQDRREIGTTYAFAPPRVFV